MDAVEFFNTISEMCREGAKTDYYKTNLNLMEYAYQGVNIDWDILTVVKNYFSAYSREWGEDVYYTLDGYWRDTLHSVESEEFYPSFENFDIGIFNEDVKLALLGYIYSIKDTLYEDNAEGSRKRKTPGWYIGGISDEVISIPELLDEYLSPNQRLIIGYRGLGEIEKSYTKDSFDLHFSSDRKDYVYYNINHAESFRGQLSFDPVFQKGMNFMNWRGVPF